MAYIPPRYYYTAFPSYPTLAPSGLPPTSSEPLNIKAGDGQTVKITFNKNTHVPRYDRDTETETEVTLIVEPRK